MTKSETLKKLAAASNEAHLNDLGQQIEMLRQARIDSAEQLATMLLPLAEAMATLTDDSRQALAEIGKQGEEQMRRFQTQFEVLERAMADATTQTQRAAASLESSAKWADWRQCFLAIATGVASGLLVSAFWLWLAPAIK